MNRSCRPWQCPTQSNHAIYYLHVCVRLLLPGLLLIFICFLSTIQVQTEFNCRCLTCLPALSPNSTPCSLRSVNSPVSVGWNCNSPTTLFLSWRNPLSMRSTRRRKALWNVSSRRSTRRSLCWGSKLEGPPSQAWPELRNSIPLTYSIPCSLLSSPVWLRSTWPSWKLYLLALLIWSPILRNASRRLPPSDRTNFGLPRICIVNYICWKDSFLGRYVMICRYFCYLHTPPDRSKRSCMDWRILLPRIYDAITK